MRVVFWSLAGLLIGGIVGAPVGLGLGALFVDLFSVSCFEGACGYFVAFIGLVGLVVAAIAGAILGAVLARRRRPPASLPGAAPPEAAKTS